MKNRTTVVVLVLGLKPKRPSHGKIRTAASDSRAPFALLTICNKTLKITSQYSTVLTAPGCYFEWVRHHSVFSQHHPSLYPPAPFLAPLPKRASKGRRYL